jgi:hypothetical protein
MLTTRDAILFQISFRGNDPIDSVRSRNAAITAIFLGELIIFNLRNKVGFRKSLCFMIPFVARVSGRLPVFVR